MDEKNIGVTHYTNSIPSTLRTAEEISDSVHLSASRIVELANAYLIPHYRVDGGNPVFSLPELKEFIKKHMTQRFEGANCFEIKVCIPAPPAISPRPTALTAIEGLKEIQTEHESGVYFLCHDSEVVYIGQSTSPRMRILNHRMAGKIFDRVFFLPCPVSELNGLEGKMIRMLKPKLNGRSRNGKIVAPCAKQEADDRSEKSRGGHFPVYRMDTAK